MKKSVKILLGVGIAIVVIVIIIFLYLYMKKKKDIKDMKEGTSSILQASGMDKNKADKVASCYIDKLVSEFGWLKTKDLYNNDTTPSDSESKKMVAFLKECS